MTMTKHTPGPWHRNIKPAKKYGIIFAGRNTHVAGLCVQGLADTEIEANCNLIAAAPELLAALRDICDVSRSYIESMDMDDLEALSRARAVIAKVIAA